MCKVQYKTNLRFTWVFKTYSIQMDCAHDRWTGFVQPAFSQRYTFVVEANDGARLWVGEEVLFDNFDEVRLSTRYSTISVRNLFLLYYRRFDPH